MDDLKQLIQSFEEGQIVDFDCIDVRFSRESATLLNQILEQSRIEQTPNHRNKVLISVVVTRLERDAVAKSFGLTEDEKSHAQLAHSKFKEACRGRPNIEPVSSACLIADHPRCFSDRCQCSCHD